MKRSRTRTRWSLIIILLIACALTYAGYRYFFPPQPSGIFLVTNTTTLTYGNTQLAGRLQKDSPVGKPGNFLLITPAGKSIYLDLQGLEKFISKTVIITGFLVPKIDNIPMTIYVKTIQLSQ